MCFGISNLTRSQSRGVQFYYNGLDSVIPANFDYYGNFSSTYEIANENVIVHTPRVKLGNSFFSLLTKFNSNLCPISTVKIPLTSGLFLDGISKKNGGFAIVSHKIPQYGGTNNPYFVRNYNNQGVLTFSKKLTDVTMGTSTGFKPRLVCNPDNNHLFFISCDFEGVTDIINLPIGLNYGSPSIKIVELSPTGNIVTQFKVTIPHYTSHYDNLGQLYFNFWEFDLPNSIQDAKFVKGTIATNDRIWLSLNATSIGSFYIDTTVYPYEANGAVSPPDFPNPWYSMITVVNTLGTLVNTTVVKDTGTLDGLLKLEIAKEAVPNTSNAELMAFSVGGGTALPFIYKFKDFSSVPISKLKIPFSTFPPITNAFNYTSFKNYHDTLLFSTGYYFGTYIPSTAQVNIRSRISTSPNADFVNFIKTTPNKLLMTHTSVSGVIASNPVPVTNILIKEKMSDFNSTCSSKFVKSVTAANVGYIYYPVHVLADTLTDIVATNDFYTSTTANTLVTVKDLCLLCQPLNVGKNADTSAVESDTLITKDSQSINFVVYPNPSSDVVSVYLNGLETGGELVIYATDGTVVYRQTLARDITTFDILELRLARPAVYNIIYTVNGVRYMQKLSTTN
jgi:hypothetical protein